MSPELSGIHRLFLSAQPAWGQVRPGWLTLDLPSPTGLLRGSQHDETGLPQTHRVPLRCLCPRRGE